MKTTTSPEQLVNGLAHFHCSEDWFKHMSGIHYSEGVQYLAEHAGAYWFIDVIGSYQRGKTKAVPFQVWTLKVNDRKAVVTMTEDSDAPELIRQEIEYTDFPLSEFQLWLIDGRLILKSEY